MITDKLTEMAECGFSVEKTPQFQTVIRHNKPFSIHGENGRLPATKVNEQYQVVFAGLCSSGQTPFMVEQAKYALISEMQQHVNKEIDVQKDDDSSNHTSAAFRDLKEGDTFFKEQDGSVRYRKTGDSVYVKMTTIAESFDLIAPEDMEVYVEMDMGLSPQQKQDLVANLPPGLAPDEFHEMLGMAFENIPGLDTLGEDEIGALHRELFDLYTAQ